MYLAKGPTESIGTDDPMNPSRLAALMLEWETKKRELDKLESEIAGAVLAIGQSKTVGNVRATFTKGRTEYDYQTPVFPEVSSALVEKFSVTETKVDWRGICLEMGKEPVIVKVGKPTISVKLIE